MHINYSDILFWCSLLILLLPLASQFFLGRKMIKNNKRKIFDVLCGLNLFLQVFCTYGSFVIQGNSFYQRALENGWANPLFNLAPPVLGLPVSFVLGILLLITGYFQRRALDKLLKLN